MFIFRERQAGCILSDHSWRQEDMYTVNKQRDETSRVKTSDDGVVADVFHHRTKWHRCRKRRTTKNMYKRQKRNNSHTHTHTKKEWADEAISWIRIHIILYFIFFVILSMVVASESRRSDFKGESWSNRPALIFEKNQQDYQHIQLSEFFSFERSFCWDLRVLERDIHSTYINTSISQSLNQVRVLRPTIPIFFHLPGGGSCVYFSPLIFLSF